MSSPLHYHLAALCAGIVLVMQPGLGAAQQVSPSATLAPSAAMMSSASVSPDAALAEQVRDALQNDRYFYGRHVDVSAEHGRVYLRGFVQSAWGLTDALRIANKAADHHPVVNELTIEIDSNGNGLH